MQKKTFKFYTHTGRYLQFRDAKNLPKKEKTFLKLILFCIEVVFGVCFYFGNFLYKRFLKFNGWLLQQLRQTPVFFKQRLLLVKQASIAKTLAIFLVIAACGWGGLFGLKMLASGLELKNKLTGFGVQGGQALLGAKTDLQNKNFNEAENKFQLAFNSFNSGQKQLQQENFVLNQLLNLFPQKQDSDKLFKAASLLSQAGSKIGKAYSALENWNLSAGGLSADGRQGLDLRKSLEEINEALKQIDQASSLLLSVNENSLPGSFKEKFVLARQNFSELQKAFHSFADLLSLANNFVGGNKRLLLILENNNELRPSGGFIGTYGDVKIKNGAITSLNISSIYDLDGQLHEKIRPPFPVVAVNDSWFLRDSNWFVDFPKSAQKISDFYEKEGGETPDEIIVLTPTVMQNLLKLTGPIELARYGVSLTAENFVEVTQVEASVNYSRVDNKPKQILADLVPVLLTRLGSLPKDQFPQLLQIIQDSLTQKQILLYSRSEKAQQEIADFNWGGNVLPSDRDYLTINSANLSGSKTDLYLKQSVNLKSEIAEDGSITNTLAITRTNTMPDLPNTTNGSFIRVLVPKGSQLVSNLGFDYNTTTLVGFGGYKIDSDVKEWEKTIVTDLVSGTSIGEEAGKTFFGNWLFVKGGQTKTITLVYKLPFKLNQTDHFSLLLQKQPGALPADFYYRLDFPKRKIVWQNFTPTDLQMDNLNYNFSLDRDFLLGEVLQNR